MIPISTNRRRLLESGNLGLTAAEIADGWHFCCDWDFMLIHPTQEEFDACCCCDLEKFRNKKESK